MPGVEILGEGIVPLHAQVSAGATSTSAIGSTKKLMLSGVGRALELRLAQRMRVW